MSKPDKQLRIEAARTARRTHMCLAMLQEDVETLRNSGAMSDAGTSCHSAAYWREFRADMAACLRLRDTHLDAVPGRDGYTVIEVAGSLLGTATLVWDCRALSARRSLPWRYLDMTLTTFLSVILGELAGYAVEASGHALYERLQAVIFGNDQPAAGSLAAAA
ncbi:MAG: hypothetical protein ACK5JO_06365 [Halodesulfovibrio sp.]